MLKRNVRQIDLLSFKLLMVRDMSGMTLYSEKAHRTVFVESKTLSL